MSWFKWDTYLKDGRNKTATVERPLPSGGQTKRVMRLPSGAIGLKLHYTYCVIFHQDGTVTYNTGGWNTITTRKFINEYGPVRVFSEKGQLRLWTSNPTITPPKVSKCRAGCKGSGQIPRRCYGPGWCYSTYREACKHGETTSHRRETCEHGQTTDHADGMINCYRCAGTGQVDYGSKQIHPAWDGDPYRFDPDDPTAGKDNVNDTGEPVTYGKSGVVTGQSYGDSGNVLAKLMPDTMADVTYPCTCGLSRASLQTVVIHLNDSERWTRERIADWLDTLDLNLRFPTP